MANNKAFIFKSLEALEAHGKIKEIYWLTESYFCEEKFKISWKDDGAVQKEMGSPNYFKFTREFKSAKI